MVGVQEHGLSTVWLEKYSRGDRTSADRFAQHVTATLHRRLLSFGLRHQDAEDLVQDCAIKVFDSISEFDPAKGSIEAWLTGFARNTARTWWRGSYMRRVAESPLDGVPEVAAQAAPSLAGSGALEAALDELNKLDRELLQLRFGEGRSFDEIAAELGLSVVNARKRVSRAVESLRRNPALRRELGFNN